MAFNCSESYLCTRILLQHFVHTHTQCVTSRTIAHIDCCNNINSIGVISALAQSKVETYIYFVHKLLYSSSSANSSGAKLQIQEKLVETSYARAKTPKSIIWAWACVECALFTTAHCSMFILCVCCEYCPPLVRQIRTKYIFLIQILLALSLCVEVGSGNSIQFVYYFISICCYILVGAACMAAESDARVREMGGKRNITCVAFYLYTWHSIRHELSKCV